MKISLFLLSGVLCLACSICQAKETLFPQCSASCFTSESAGHKDIKQTVMDFFDSSPRSGRFYEAKTSLLSRELASLVQKAKAEEEWSSECVRNSKYPTDKPKIIEGDIYTRSWERHTRMDVSHISSDANSGQVYVKFYSDDYTPVIPWFGFVSLIREHGQWKIDDILTWELSREVIFTAGSIRDYFSEFLKRHDGCF